MGCIDWCRPPSPSLTSIERLTKISDESGSRNYAYDDLGRVTGKTQVVAGTKTLRRAYG